MRALACTLLFILCSAGLWAQPKTSDGFSLPVPGRVFAFPRDHGSHPDFKIEWWYVTGHLHADNERLGFQATFFRRARRLPGMPGDEQIHLAHMALSDIAGKRFLHQERIAREGFDAHSSTETLAVVNGPWSLRLEEGNGTILRLEGGIRAEASFSLQLDAVKPLVFFGENGVSRKGDDPTAASHYLTFPRLRVTGSLTLDGRTREVRGEGWMDHEISSSQLSRDQAGWDWVCIQFPDMREIMLYRLRRKDGTTDPASRLTWVRADGTTREAAFTWTPRGNWVSPVSGATYPATIEIGTEDPDTGSSQTFIVQPLLPDQELRGGVAGIDYWEGACVVSTPDQKAAGSAYLELTGYKQQLEF